VYRLLSDYEPAAEHYLVASAKFRDQGDAPAEAETTAKVGDIFSWIGEFRTASVYYEKALAIYRKLGNAIQQIRILASLADATGRGGLGTVEKVDYYLEEASKLQQSLDAGVKKELEAYWQKYQELMTFKPEQQDIEYAIKDYARRYNKP